MRRPGPRLDPASPGKRIHARPWRWLPGAAVAAGGEKQGVRSARWARSEPRGWRAAPLPGPWASPRLPRPVPGSSAVRCISLLRPPPPPSRGLPPVCLYDASSRKDTSSHVELRTHPTPVRQDPVSKPGHSHRCWGLGLQRVSLGDTVQPRTMTLWRNQLDVGDGRLDSRTSCT